jgi:hypothetical protein
MRTGLRRQDGDRTAPRKRLRTIGSVPGELADPLESLEAELDISSLAPGSSDANFRILVRHGQTQALRPSLWR